MLEIERRLRQTEDTAENYKREGVELRRSLSDVTKEKDTLNLSNTQLRETLRGAETERIRYEKESKTVTTAMTGNASKNEMF